MIYSSRSVRARRVGSSVALLGLLLFTQVASTGADADSTSRAVCENLNPPAGSKLVFHTYAAGVQIYRWTGTGWLFDGPSAALYADPQGRSAVGIHYGGPTWQSASGSKVKAGIVDRCTPDPDAIPWLLLGVTSSEGPGIFARVDAIQRVNTVGGKEPTYSGTNVGDVARVPYTAEYYFYRVR